MGYKLYASDRAHIDFHVYTCYNIKLPFCLIQSIPVKLSRIHVKQWSLRKYWNKSQKNYWALTEITWHVSDRYLMYR